MTRTLKLFIALAGSLLSFQAVAQDNNPPAPAAGTEGAAAAQPPPAAPAQEKKKKGGPSLGLSPEAPQVGGLVVSPAEQVSATEEPASSEWKFDVTGYFRAPFRMSWGPATTVDPAGGSSGTQLRTPPMVPDANYIDWRYTNRLVAPWTELNFHYGNDRVKAMVQIASYNLTDPGYRRLEANLGINQAFLSLSWPELANVEDLHLRLTVGGFTNRYGAAGRYDAGKYETYLFGRTHVAGATANLEYDVSDVTISVEGGGGAKLETIPFYGAPGPSANPNTSLPVWEPYPGPVPMESAFVVHGHLGLVWKKMVLAGLHYIDVFANDNERANAYRGMIFGGRPSSGMGSETPKIRTMGADVKLLGGVVGDGYIGASWLEARNAQYIGDAIEVIHSFGGWQLFDNYFGPKGQANPNASGNIFTLSGQYIFSFGQLFNYPQAFWGDGPDLIVALFAMFNSVTNVADPGNACATPGNAMCFNIKKFKAGTEVTYIPLPWLGLGGRYDLVNPNLDDSQRSFSITTLNLIFRTAFVTHEQVLLGYSRYFYGDAYVPMDPRGGSQYPWSTQPGAAGLGVDKNTFQVAGIIWF